MSNVPFPTPSFNGVIERLIPQSTPRKLVAPRAPDVTVGQ